MNETPKTKSGWRWIRRILIALAVLATLIAIFYAEEDWRGKRAWENCKRELEAKGEVLDWNKFIPPPVPDDQNFFAAPKMQEWFVGRGRSELSKRLQATNEALTASVGLITTAAAARSYLSWSDQFEPDFNLMSAALKRPYARMDGDYSQPYEFPIPKFITVRAVAQMLAQRAHCYLLLNQPEKSLDELTLLNDSRRLLECAPTGKPMTLVAAMINVDVTGQLYVDTIASGLRSHSWLEPQLEALQNQLQQIDLMPFVAEAFNEECTFVCLMLANMSQAELENQRLFETKQLGVRVPPKLEDPEYLFVTFAPRGWIYQNTVRYATLMLESIPSYDLTNQLILPQTADDWMKKVASLKKWNPYSFFEAMFLPNLTKATQTVAYNQTMVNEAQIACALERYRLAHGEYPDALDALAPPFIETIPHDIIGGQPLHYKRMSDGKFLLYSVGWNEMDDGGKDGGTDFTKADWVWKN